MGGSLTYEKHLSLTALSARQKLTQSYGGITDVPLPPFCFLMPSFDVWTKHTHCPVKGL